MTPTGLREQAAIAVLGGLAASWGGRDSQKGDEPLTEDEADLAAYIAVAWADALVRKLMKG